VTTYTPPPRQALTDAGRKTLADAVAIDHDWSLPASGMDKLIAALADLTDEDLEIARLAAHYLNEAAVCVQIERDMAADAERRAAAAIGEQATAPAVPVMPPGITIADDEWDGYVPPVPSPGWLNHGDASRGPA
jgi:hypothetical protein